ncbi:MAG TPA: DUF4397 domain-containing protein [Nocardioides sp.]|uniref:DUF4397 domain-containing protein n=1 Tax=uncultured Nocardioides sp. TaxID=198441 RepID=UPI002626A570|nr:DUF4397 domain-containing protein [uncultured Nocardioides sp.]HRI97749.1 DUF4397 domain-containing protein [Nocardioides sp.]
MTRERALRAGLATALAVGLLAATQSTGTAAASRERSPSITAALTQGAVAIVQAVPDETMAIVIDGDEVRDSVVRGAVLRVDLAPGDHEVEFRFGSASVAASVKVEAGTTSDVVVHRPAEVDGDPIVSVFPQPVQPIALDKARVLLAHTATTAPADAEVDGRVVFRNIANGEYADADVPAGQHRVALVPAGVDGPPILGPLEVDLATGTLTSVYAVGNPLNRSMDVIVLETPLPGDGSEAPTRVETGSAGLVTYATVLTFRSR